MSDEGIGLCPVTPPLAVSLEFKSNNPCMEASWKVGFEESDAEEFAVYRNALADLAAYVTARLGVIFTDWKTGKINREEAEQLVAAVALAIQTAE